ncbi:MAG: hypothetical protein LAO31_22100 [Acidobacteriia bacterium]|nr:hypothetical protein [Terriglobia bacterium]
MRFPVGFLGVIMFCPHCKTEYQKGITRCIDCDEPPVWSLPPEPDKPESRSLPELEEAEAVALPPMGLGDLVVIQSLLKAAGIAFIMANESGRGGRPTIVIRASDKADVRELLKDLDVEFPLGTRGPLKW